MKNITQKTIFLYLVTSGTYSIRLTANLRAQIDSRDSGLSFGHLTILLAGAFHDRSTTPDTLIFPILIKFGERGYLACQKHWS